MKRVVWFLPGIILFVWFISIIGNQPSRAKAQEPITPAPALDFAGQNSGDPGEISDVTPEIGDVPEEISGVPGVTGAWWATVQEQIRRDMYSLTAAEADGESSHRGYNLAHNFAITFAGDGLQLAAGQIRLDPQDETSESLAAAAKTGPDWQWSLRLTGYGYAGRVQPLPSIAEASASENRLEYRRAGISEYYINDEHGLEQGFTLEAPPPGTADGEELVLEMALNTDLVPILSGDPAVMGGQAIEFTQPDGNVILLRYSDLYADDASGGSLPARMVLSGCGRHARPGSCRLQLLVESAGARYPLRIDPLLTVPDWAALGENTGDGFGYSVATAGDVNGDGYADLVVGAPHYGGNLYDGRGKAYVFHGSPAGLDDTPAWTAIGENDTDRFGHSVATAGDVNGDGYDDLVVGTWDSVGAWFGLPDRAYVYHGSPAGLGDTPAWFTIEEDVEDRFAYSVATAGDVNGDGYDDLVVGDPYGAVYIYHGSSAGLGKSNREPDWITRDWIREDNTSYGIGYSVATAGDVNGDGYSDLVVGSISLYQSVRGTVYVYHGSPAGLGENNRIPDWSTKGENSNDNFGISVGTAGNVNGKGCSDLVVGADGYDGGRGKIYVYHGKQGGLSQEDPPKPDWTASGEEANDHFGAVVATAGDVNDDYYADLVVGAFEHDGGRGKVYIYHGSDAGLDRDAAWTASGENVNDNFGRDVSMVGDLNGDGYSDLAIGTSDYDGSRGKVYAFHGSALGLNPAFDWTAGGEEADDRFGLTLGTAGDVNDDGYSDLAIGAPYFKDDNDKVKGKVYLYYGDPAGPSPGWTAIGESDSNYFGYALGAAGDVNGDGFDDLAVGDYGYDGGMGKVYVYYGTAKRIESGQGPDPDWSVKGGWSNDRLGRTVGGAGDVNGDGFADLFVGAPGYPQGQGYGQVLVYHGSDSGLGSQPAWIASGEMASDQFGSAVGAAGDVNGDGVGDLVVGAWRHSNYRGKFYLYHGSSPGGLGSEKTFTEIGENEGDYLGWAVNSAGDVNGDGYSDLAIGAWGYDAGANDNAGRVDLYHGSSKGITGSIAISLIGQISGEHFGYALGTAGDVDGDGYADLIVGAPGYQYNRGKITLYLGAADGLGNEPTWSATGRRGGDHYGAAVGTAGDMDGDGYSDLVAGAWGYDAAGYTNAGAVYAYRGAASRLRTTATWTDSSDPDNHNVSVATAGDVNGDGFADLVVGFPNHIGGWGKAYVYHGSPAGLDDTFSWTVTGEEFNDLFGEAVGGAGDVNGDGFADIVVGAPAYGSDRGKAYVYHGSSEGLEETPTWTATGKNTYSGFADDVATAGDLNGDGYADIVVKALFCYLKACWTYAHVYHGSDQGLETAPGWTITNLSFIPEIGSAGDVNGDGYGDLVVSNSFTTFFPATLGEVYVYHGSPAGLDDTPTWTATGEEDDMFGSSVGSAGDVNGDGYADIVVLARGYDGFRGKVYVYHGSAHGLDVPFSTFVGGDEGELNAGGISAVDTAGDVNGDGFADLVVGANGYMTSTGRIYIYQGSPLGLTPTFEPVAAGENERDFFGSIVGSAGDVNGDGYADIVAGAHGYGGNRSKVYLYHGNDGGGRSALAYQVRGDGSGYSVQPWGPAYTSDSFGVSLQAVNPLGRGRARLQVQACPPGTPFGHPDDCLDQKSDKWIEISSGGDVQLNTIVDGLEEGELYRWRARALYDAPLYSHSPWRRLMGQALEGDVRVTRLAADLSLTKTMDPAEPLDVGDPITFTLAFSSTGPARGVVISDTLPSEFSVITEDISSEGVTISLTDHLPCCVWEVEDFETGEGGVITIPGIGQAERFVNTATISGTSPDPDPDNNEETVQTHIPGVIFVDTQAQGANNGLSWANAYIDLQEALAEAKPGDQIWIAGGIYRPVASGLRTHSFELVSGVELHGGFDGSENWLHERDPAAPETILSGDIGTVGNPDDNLYHVISATHVISSTVLEGLTINGGNADGNGENGLGGGLYSKGGSLRLINVTFAGNAAIYGGGLYNEGGSPTLFNVAFSGNVAESEGGGMVSAGSSPILINTTFSRNTAGSGGGIFHTGGGDVSLTNSILWGNSGGQITIDDGSAVVSYSDVQGGCPAGATCNDVISKDPQFWNALGEDELAGTLDDDLRIYTTFRHPSPVIDQGDNSALPYDDWDLDGDEDNKDLFPLDLSGRWRLVGFTNVVPTVDLGAYEATIVDVLAEGDSLFEQGEAFRLENLQLLSSDSLAEALQNYANFNDGEWYNAFCADYDQIDEEGYCPESDPQAVRNTLLDAVDLYRVAVGWPTEDFTTIGGIAIPVWYKGAQGVLSSTTEIANVHLIFGNEFLVDATDYRFSTAGIPYADQIIAQELDELGQAQLQFELIMSLVFRAFNEWGVGTDATGDQFEQFGVASSLLMSTLNETAARYYMLRQSEQALAVFEEAYSNQYLQMMALDQMAEDSGAPYLQDGSWEMLNNLSQMRERAQAISQGLDFFGFAPEYVPLQAYEQLLELTEGPTGDTGLLGTARDLEDQARDAQRTFDANASDMATELDNLTVDLDNQLFELCGASDDDYETCDGGLMAQNLEAMYAASLRVGLARLRAQNIAEQIKIESDRAGQVVTVQLGLGQELSAYELAIGKLEAHRTTKTALSSSEDQIQLGVEASARLYAEAYAGVSYTSGDLFPKGTVGAKSGFERAVEATAGYHHAWTWTDTTQTVWDPTAEKIAGYESLKALKQAEAQAEIEGANSAAAIRNLLLQQSEALEDYQIAEAEFNQLAAEHNYLAQRRSRLINQRYQAVNRVANHNSHLLSPAYRIWRDSLTTQSAQTQALAAQFAYLTARAAEYELLTPYPDLGQIFRARTANDIRLFLDGLKVWVQALDRPGQLNHYPYTISLAQDIWGLTGQALDPDGELSAEELQQVRYERFQELLQSNRDGDRLELWFSTALDQQRAENQYLFSPNIWNNRIAGIGAPLDQTEGVRLNIVTRQAGDVGELEALLVHGGSTGGAEAYRNAAGAIVYYDPDTAVPVGYLLPDELDPANTTAVLRPGINGQGGIANGALLNLSVATANWTFRIPADSRGNLDYSQIEDIEILLDSTGRALPDRAQEAEEDALLLQSGQELAPTDIKPVYRAPAPIRSSQIDLLPAEAGQIGGSYFGSIVVTSPITLTIQVLNIDLINEGGTLSGQVKGSETSLYPDDLSLNGQVLDNNAFQLTSQPFTSTIASQLVTQVFTLSGHMEEDGDILRAEYSGTITNLLPDPIQVGGRFSASRPGAVGSERLVLKARSWSVQPGAGTTITATLYDETMARISETRTITFTTDLGTIIPTVADIVDGQEVVTFIAGETLGQATIVATTGDLTGTVRIQIGESGVSQQVANFSASPRTGYHPLEVNFSDLSAGGPTSWAWDFGDGDSSTVRHPTHIYTEKGSYTVTLKVSNDEGSDSITKQAYIIVTAPEPPVAGFSHSPGVGMEPLTVQFTDQSSGVPTSWAWDFGDNTTSSEQHPSHTYLSSGTYTVTLTVANAIGSDVLEVENCVEVLAAKKVYLPLGFKP